MLRPFQRQQMGDNQRNFGRQAHILPLQHTKFPRKIQCIRYSNLPNYTWQLTARRHLQSVDYYHHLSCILSRYQWDQYCGIVERARLFSSVPRLSPPPRLSIYPLYPVLYMYQSAEITTRRDLDIGHYHPPRVAKTPTARRQWWRRGRGPVAGSRAGGVGTGHWAWAGAGDWRRSRR